MKHNTFDGKEDDDLRLRNKIRKNVKNVKNERKNLLKADDC